MLYDNFKIQAAAGTTETADNPQYEDSMKHYDTPADPTSNENVYSYAIP